MFSRGTVTPRVILVDHNGVGSDMGASARPVIEQALSDNGVETRTGVGVAAVRECGVSLSSGEQLEAATVVWCAGMRASSLTEQLPVARDRLGRVPVDDYLRVIGVPTVFAAGDIAAARMDDEHLFGDVVSARAADGSPCRLQRDQRPVRPADAGPPDPLVCDGSRSRGRPVRCTPRDGTGRWLRLARKPKPPSRRSIPGGSIPRRPAAVPTCWPRPHQNCRPAPDQDEAQSDCALSPAYH